MSESEGEFGKEFRAWLNIFVPNIVAKEMETELFKILEEAKKEFPDPKDAWKVYDWFKKWLGSPETPR